MYQPRGEDVHSSEHSAFSDAQAGIQSRTGMNPSSFQGQDRPLQFATPDHAGATQYHQTLFGALPASSTDVPASAASQFNRTQNQYAERIDQNNPRFHYAETPDLSNHQPDHGQRWGDGGQSFQQQLLHYQQRAMSAHDQHTAMTRDQPTQSTVSSTWHAVQSGGHIDNQNQNHNHNHNYNMNVGGYSDMGQAASQNQQLNRLSLSAASDPAPHHLWLNERSASAVYSMPFLPCAAEQNPSLGAIGASGLHPSGNVGPLEGGVRAQSGILQYHDIGQSPHSVLRQDYATGGNVAQGAYLNTPFLEHFGYTVSGSQGQHRYDQSAPEENSSHLSTTSFSERGDSAYNNGGIGTISSYDFSGLPIHPGRTDQQQGPHDHGRLDSAAAKASSVRHPECQSPSDSIDENADALESADESDSHSAIPPNAIPGNDSADLSKSPGRHGTSSESSSSKVRKSARKLYECSQCTRTFPRPSALIVHERIHSGQKPFVCEVCSRPFTVASNLRRHQKIHVKQLKADASIYVAQSDASTLRPAGAIRSSNAALDEASHLGIDGGASEDESASTDGSTHSYPTTRTSLSASTVQSSDSQASATSPRMQANHDIYYQANQADIASWSQSLQMFGITQPA